MIAFRLFILMILMTLSLQTLQAGDWAMWRHDASRSAATPDEIPKDLKLLWRRELPPTSPAWPQSQTKLQFDRGYEPIVMGKQMFVGSSHDDSVSTYSTETGQQEWKFFADGPIRFAPVANDGRLYVVSDDGYLYCLNVTDGKELWKVRGGPSDRKILGNDRLISTWPARGAPVLSEGIVYFAASIWPSMGTFIHAVDAQSGKLIWTNSETGSQYMKHPHGGAYSFGSIAPQGYLVINGDTLLVPGGRSVPAAFDKKTGKMKYFLYEKRQGGSAVTSAGKYFFVQQDRFSIKDGTHVGAGKGEVFSQNAEFYYSYSTNSIRSNAISGNVIKKTTTDRRGRKVTKVSFENKNNWVMEIPKIKIDHVYAKVGSRLFVGGKSLVAAFETNLKNGEKKKVTPQWSAKVKGYVWNIIAADDKLFVVTDEHLIYCFGESDIQPKTTFNDQPSLWPSYADRGSFKINVTTLKTKLKLSEGYAVVLGVNSGQLIRELLKQTKLRLIVIEKDKKKVDQFRLRLASEGHYGNRVSVHPGNFTDYPLPPYLANLIISERTPGGVRAHPGAPSNKEATPELTEKETIEHLFHSLRPYGGVLCFPASEVVHTRFQKVVDKLNLKKASVSRIKNKYTTSNEVTGFSVIQNDLTAITRTGQLPGAANWQGQYADAANSIVSQDKLVRAPLGVLWFGGPSNDKILPRHGHGPSPQVAGGRLIIEGPDIMRAVDVYTGRLLWERELKGVGEYYNVTKHFAGAGEVGSNYFTLADAVYVIHNGSILELDATTGKTTKEFESPTTKDGKPTAWGFMTVSDDYLIATSETIASSEKATKGSGSRQLVVFNRKTQKQLWSMEAKYNFRHNAICASNGKLFCIDNLSKARIKILNRRGVTFKGKPRLLALDIQTGKEIWSTEKNIFGTFLNYSVKHDVLLQAGSNYRDRAKDESKEGMVAYKGTTGDVIWKNLKLKYGGPCLLWKDKIITNGESGFQLDLLTGKRNDWTFRRMYGCNTIIGGQNLLTFRSGAAGFCDLENNSGTGNLSGFKSSCTANLIIADGLLNAPDYTRTCSCSYSNQTSLAFIYMPEAEEWTYSHIKLKEDYIRTLGINLGAAGDRRDEKSTLWLDYPFVGGPTPQIKIEVTGDNPRWFRNHSSIMAGKGPKWIGSSGAEGLDTIKVKLVKEQNKTQKYTIRLYFAEPDEKMKKERVMNVSMQGKVVLKNFNIRKDAGGAKKTIYKEFKGIQVTDSLDITLQSVSGKTLLSGVEVIAE